MANKNPKNLWKKGQSGNPSGRPKVAAEVRALARKHTKEAIATLVELCASADKDSTRVAAANSILDRGYGKPPQAVDIVARNLSDEEIEAEVRRRIAERGDGES